MTHSITRADFALAATGALAAETAPYYYYSEGRMDAGQEPLISLEGDIPSKSTTSEWFSYLLYRARHEGTSYTNICGHWENFVRSGGTSVGSEKDQTEF